MAYYYIDFIGLRSRLQYQLRIAKASGDNVMLTGAAVPFVTEEDDDDFAFKPVRLQTGYIGIVDLTGEQWKGLVSSSATDVPVTLYRGGGIVWEGFIQPGGLRAEYGIMPQTVQIPVMCRLSALEAFDVEPAEFDIPSFGEIIHYILGKAGGCRYVSFQGSGAFVEDILSKRVNHGLFSEKDVDGNDVPRFDCLTLLERICEFWGWTARTDGQDVLFLSPADPAVSGTLTTYEYRDLQDIGSAQPTVSQTGSVTMTRTAFPSARRGDEDEIIPGRRKATVTADISAVSSSLELPIERVCESERISTNSVSNTPYGTDGTHFMKYGAGEFTNTEDAEQGTDLVEVDGYSVEIYDDLTNFNAQFRLDDYYEGDLQYKHDYDFSPSLAVYAGYVPDGNWCVRISSDRPLAFSSGVLWVAAKIHRDYIGSGRHARNNATGTMVCRLRVGDDWWNGSAWTHTGNSTFNVSIGTDDRVPADGEGMILSTRHYTDSTESYEGYGMPVSGSIQGTLFFEIVRIYLSDAQAGSSWWVSISSLRFGFANNLNAVAGILNKDSGQNTYVRENAGQYPDEISVETLFASDNANGYGLAVLMNANYSKLRTVQYGSTGEHPEQHLADTMAAYYAVPSRKLTVSVQSHLTPLAPADTVERDGADFIQLAVTHEWRDDVEKITLIEK